jgi:hypothetical protein
MVVVVRKAQQVNRKTTTAGDLHKEMTKKESSKTGSQRG